MISDTLSDAVATIREYQEAMPECYEKIRDKIDRVVGEMEKLRIFLDTPPSCLIED